LPFVRVPLKSLKPSVIPAQPTTLGEHLAARRRALGITQPQAAAVLKVSPETVLHWEKDTRVPPDTYWPTILSYLGYDPYALTEAATLADKLKAWRRVRGLSIKKAARSLGVDEGTWSQWEEGLPPKQRAHQAAVCQILALSTPGNSSLESRIPR
jgi:DNA-binding transcriptional regulator YiaG